ncbi:MAG: glucose-1-phosphate thymidylyltransferase [Thermoplasmata archaeon]|nr:MAG: glucose-1-phosphate thymidylyltransferase [Thermoplasmata archaeon]
MKCVVLAAGEGKRVRPLTYTRPKVMLPIANKPLLEWNLLNAIRAGINDFVFIIGYKGEKIRDYFGDGSKWNVKIRYLNQGKPIGTAHAVSLLKGQVGEFIVMCGDTIFGHEDIKKIAEHENSMGVVNVENPEQYGVVEIQGDKVVKIREKEKFAQSNLINAGIYHFDKDIFGFIEKTGISPRGEYELTDSINLMIKEKKIKWIKLKEWRDVVYPWHLLDINAEMLKSVEKKIDGDVEKGAFIKGEVIVGKGTKILSGSYIEGPVVIGENSKIGPNCYIRPFTSIGNNCRVGNACEVKNSIVMDGSKIPHQNYVGDSIISSDCNLGAGTKIANLRLDKKEISVTLNGEKIKTERRKLGAIIGDNVQTGINAMINPGTIIGNNVFIGPGAIADGEIKPNARIM